MRTQISRFRVLAAGLNGIGVATPGVMVRKHGQSAEAPHLTHSASKAQRAGYFAEILSRNAVWLATRPDALMFLQRRQMKLLVQAGEVSAAWGVLKSNGGLGAQLSQMPYLLGEMVAAKLRRKS